MKTMLTAAIALISAGALHAQTSWYVDGAHCDGSGQGTIDDPYCTIQEAIDAAADGDSVLIASGVYPEHLVLKAQALTLRCKEGTWNPPVIGDAGPAQVPLLTVPPGASVSMVHLMLRGGLPAIDADGAMLSLSSCSFTDNHGAQDALDCAYGGAIVARGSSLSLSHCTLTENEASLGGALWMQGGSLEILDTTFVQNQAYDCHPKGGALYAEGTDVRILSSDFDFQVAEGALGTTAYFTGCTLAVEDTIFQYGYGTQSDGGVYVDHSEAVFLRCSFFHNQSDQGEGGGLLVAGDLAHVIVVEDTVFEGNRSDEAGAVDLNAGVLSFRRCRFEDNQSASFTTPETGYGGAVYIHPAANATFERCVFLDNVALGTPSAPGYGGAVFGPCYAENCSFYRNRTDEATGGQGGALAGGADALSSIFRGNLPDQVFVVGSIRYSDMEGDWPGEGNFDADPLFWGPLTGDLHLTAGSPCVDTGAPWMQDDDGSRVDVGAYAYDPSYCGTPGNYCSAKESSDGCLPVIGSSGTPSLTGADDFHVLATMVPPRRQGLLTWSDAADSLPFMGGTLCLATPLSRSKLLLSSSGSSACDGLFDYHFTQAHMASEGLQPGMHLYLQYWFRDSMNPDGTGLGLSDGLEVTICN